MQSNTNNDVRRQIRRIPLYKDEPRTIGELFRDAAKKHALDNALNYKSEGSWTAVSSREIIERAENIALGLYSLGLNKGDRAAILAANSPDWTLTDAGCQFACVVDVPIYTTLGVQSIYYILKDSGTRVFFLENKKTFERLGDLFGECPSLEKVVLFNAEGVEDERAMSLEDLENQGAKLKSEKSELLAKAEKSVKPHDVATLIYTSGTTGEPKGVMLSHENILSNVIDAGENFSFTKNDVPLSVLPLSHVFERSAMYLYIFNGMSVYYAESIDKVPENLREVRPTMFVGVPRIFEKVYAKAKERSAENSIKEKLFEWAINVGKKYAAKNERGESISYFFAVQYSIADKLVFTKMRDFFGGRLRFCITGGAALSDEIYFVFTGANVKIMQGYGLTETSPVISTNTPENARAGTVGKTIRNVEIRFAEDGEIEVSGPNVMLGYYNKPDATRDAFTADGWFKTGDVGALNDGFLKITDRKKELFKTSGGKYIAPAPIEQMIKGSRFVNQVVLIGNDRKFPSALIVPDFESLKQYAKSQGIKADSPNEMCRDEKIVKLIEKEIEKLTPDLGQYEKVKKIALLEDEMTVESGELTPTLKVKRRVVDEKYKDLIDKIYA